MLGWIGFALAMTGQILIIYKIKYAFIVWNIANLIWIILAVARHDNPQIFMFAAYIIANIFSYLKWNKDEIV